MRVRILISNTLLHIHNRTLYKKGDVIIYADDNDNLPSIIQEGIVEKFNYSLSDDEITKTFDKYSRPCDYGKLIEFFIKICETDKVNNVLLNDGTNIEAKASSKTDYEWQIYNIIYIKYYSEKSPESTFEGLKKAFYKKLNNSPSTERFIEKEYQYLQSLIAEHKTEMGDRLTGDPNILNTSWYDKTLSGIVPKTEPELNSFLNQQLAGGPINFFKGKALAEYEVFLTSFISELKRQKNSKEEYFTTLPQSFKNEYEYKKVMDLLVNEKYCNEETFIWIDEKKGWKKLLASLIIHLHSKGYCKRRLSNPEVISIAKNTFQIDMGEDTVKHAKGSDYKFDFITPSNFPE